MSTTLPPSVPGEIPAPVDAPISHSDLSTRVVAPAIQKSLDAFRAALPELLKNKTQEQEWVAFRGDQLVTFGRTQSEAYQECLRRGLKHGTFIVLGVDAEIQELEIMHEP